MKRRFIVVNYVWEDAIGNRTMGKDHIDADSKIARLLIHGGEINKMRKVI